MSEKIQEVTLFDEYSLQDLFKQIVTNSRQTRKHLKQTIQQIADFLQDKVDLQILSPQISNYMNIMVKNDQLLLKLANAVTKIVSVKNRFQEESDELTQEQKKQLIEQAKKQITPILQRVKERENEKKDKQTPIANVI